MGHDFLTLFLVFLSATVIVVPIFQRLKLGAVLGYLIAGIIIGPFALGLVTEVENIAHFSEFGVVLLLFLIGLELEPKKLWSMRVKLFGLGGMQVAVTTLLFTLISKAFGLSWPASIALGMAITHGSTAIAVQLLKAKGTFGSSAGQSAFALALFQDISVIPMLSVLGVLAVSTTAVEEQSGWMTALKIIGLLVGVLVGGRLLLRPILRWIASVHLREVFTALALLLVTGMAALMQVVDLSMGLGAFLAGVLLADSEYRAALETDIEPFKGLLLGLFFMAVGMGLNLDVIQSMPFMIIGATAAIVALKAGILFGIGRLFKLPKGQDLYFAMVMSQVGEFAFVLLAVAKAGQVLSAQNYDFVAATVALSMMTTPILAILHEKFIETKSNAKPESDKMENEGNPVIIAGFGRFGQIIGRLLYANRISATVLDYEPDQIETLRKFGFKVFYGDATRIDLLETAGAANAKILIAAIDDQEENLRLVELVSKHFPHLKIFARARNVRAVYEFMDLKVHNIQRELFEGSLRMGVDVLNELGFPKHEAVRSANKFRDHNVRLIEELHPIRTNQEELVAKTKQARSDLEKMFEKEAERRAGPFSAWSPND